MLYLTKFIEDMSYITYSEDTLIQQNTISMINERRFLKMLEKLEFALYCMIKAMPHYQPTKADIEMDRYMYEKHFKKS